MVVLRPRTGCFWYATLAKPEKYKLAKQIIGECLGWAGRAGAYHCPYNKTLFSLQISILIICMHYLQATLLESTN